ncbi:MAG TPA: NADH-quinone oxidoreductase subunit NuoE [Alphaproteobacteria bacterium]|jgi:NADH-quinone oxidoreductase subunit E|nr:NADH-quinone oxidoreductase subunit NuoE [Alphaproteobacteria bacterium]
MSASVGIADNGPEQPKEFAFTAENLEKAKTIIAKYPAGRQQSAVMPLLDLAQRQHGGWLPRVAMDVVADMLSMPRIKAYEVATFYSMYNLKPVGKHFVQVCTTTPCWLVGSEGVVDACKKHLGIGLGETTADGQFTLVEVECLGACVNAPMAQINDDYYEDLNPENTVALLKALAEGKPVKTGSQTGRRGSQAASGPTSLHEFAKAAGVES